MTLDRLALSAAFLLLVGLHPARALAEGMSGWTDPSGANKTVRVEYDPTKPVPPGFHVEERSMSSSLVPVGTVVFALSYAPLLYWGTSAIAQGKSYRGCPSNRWLVLPLAGPFIASTAYGGPRAGLCEDPEDVEKAIVVNDGILQVAGAALIVIGLIPPWHVLVKDGDPGSTAPSTRSSNGAHFRVIPWQVGTSAAGVDLVGTF